MDFNRDRPAVNSSDEAGVPGLGSGLDDPGDVAPSALGIQPHPEASLGARMQAQTETLSTSTGSNGLSDCKSGLVMVEQQTTEM